MFEGKGLLLKAPRCFRIVVSSSILSETARGLHTPLFMRATTIVVEDVAGPLATKRSRARERAAAVMVLGALFQFVKRLCILVVGLLRLSYRKVGPRVMSTHSHNLRLTHAYKCTVRVSY